MFGGLYAKDDVIQYRKAFDQLKVLVDHADAQCIGIVGVFDLDDLSVFLDLSLFRLIQTEENAHQGRLAGAVFAKQGVYLAFPQLKCDVIICNDARKPLRDVEHFDCIRCIHGFNLLYSHRY